MTGKAAAAPSPPLSCTPVSRARAAVSLSSVQSQRVHRRRQVAEIRMSGMPYQVYTSLFEVICQTPETANGFHSGILLMEQLTLSAR